jgi:hypothetical protein
MSRSRVCDGSAWQGHLHLLGKSAVDFKRELWTIFTNFSGFLAVQLKLQRESRSFRGTIRRRISDLSFLRPSMNILLRCFSQQKFIFYDFSFNSRRFFIVKWLFSAKKRETGQTIDFLFASSHNFSSVFRERFQLRCMKRCRDFVYNVKIMMMGEIRRRCHEKDRWQSSRFHDEATPEIPQLAKYSNYSQPKLISAN